MRSPLEVMNKYGKCSAGITARYHNNKIDYDQFKRYVYLITKAAKNEMRRATEAMQQRSFSRGYEAATKPITWEVKP